MPIQTTIFSGKAGTTFEQASTDTSQALTAASIKVGGKNAQGAIITVEDNTIRYAFGTAPTQAGLGHSAAAGTKIVLDSSSLVHAFRFISAVAATPGSLQVTPIF